MVTTDTDKLMYEIKTKDIYADFSRNKDVSFSKDKDVMLDFSNYSASQNMMVVQTN